MIDPHRVVCYGEEEDRRKNWDTYLYLANLGECFSIRMRRLKLNLAPYFDWAVLPLECFDANHSIAALVACLGPLCPLSLKSFAD